MIQHIKTIRKQHRPDPDDPHPSPKARIYHALGPLYSGRRAALQPTGKAYPKAPDGQVHPRAINAESEGAS